MLPFTHEQFLGVFVTYNDAIWPLQIVACLFGIIVVVLLFRPSRSSDRIIAGALAAMWVWTGVVYHGLFFAPINAAAYLYGALFLLQGGFLAYAGVQRDRLRFGFQPGLAAGVGAVFLFYAVVLYQALRCHQPGPLATGIPGDEPGRAAQYGEAGLNRQGAAVARCHWASICPSLSNSRAGCSTSEI
jgi:hypothetical protein